MKKLLACVGFGVVVAVAGQSPSSAAPPVESRPGEKWLECFVGKGGLATPDEVFFAARAALDRGDGETLRALALDRCASFRVCVLEHEHWIIAASALQHDDELATYASDVKARLFFEEAQLASLPVDSLGESFATFESLPNRQIVTSETQRVQVQVQVVSIDGRWYLWSRPTLVASPDRVVSRFRTLATDLSNELHKHKTAKPALLALDAWWKRRGAELEKLAQAARTFEGGSEGAGAMATMRGDFASALGPLATDDQIAERLRPVFLRLTTGRVGVPICDEYIDKMKLCGQKMPGTTGPAISQAMDQTVEAWTEAASTPAGRAALEAGCKSATDAVAGSMGEVCPGVF